MKQTHCIFPKRYRKSVQQFALTHQGEKTNQAKKPTAPPKTPPSSSWLNKQGIRHWSTRDCKQPSDFKARSNFRSIQDQQLSKLQSKDKAKPRTINNFRTLKKNKAHIFFNYHSTDYTLDCSTIQAKASTSCRAVSVGLTEVN